MRTENIYLLSSTTIDSQPERTIMQFDTGFTWDQILKSQYNYNINYPDYTYQTNFMLYMRCTTYGTT